MSNFGWPSATPLNLAKFGAPDSDDIADAFSNYCNELYNSVDYDQDGMNVLYNEDNDGICHCSGNYSHNINSSNIKDAILTN